MPSTPQFTLRQDKDTVTVAIRVPYVRVADMEFIVDGLDFTFYCKPYLLKLKLPGKVVDSEAFPGKAVYDIEKENGTITVQLHKETPGFHFEDLDMITKLMQPTKVQSQRVQPGDPRMPPCIEVMESATFVAGPAAPTNSTSAGDPKASSETSSPSSTASPRKESLSSEPTLKKLRGETPYGFNRQFTSFLKGLSNEFPALTRVPSPAGAVSHEERQRLRVAEEDAAFDGERYMCDFVGAKEDPLFQAAMQFEASKDAAVSPQAAARTPTAQPARLPDAPPPPSPSPSRASSEAAPVAIAHSLAPASSSATSSGGGDFFKEHEREALRQLPNKEHLIVGGSACERRLLCGLVDILFAHAFDRRMTTDDPNVESAWNIWTLSPTLCWMAEFDSIADVLTTSFRRGLAFPYLRNWRLLDAVLKDVVSTVSCGRRTVLRRLLQVRRIFQMDDQRYLINKLYIDDYCIWVQHLSDSALQGVEETLRDLLRRGTLTKEAVKWPLCELEKYVISACAEMTEPDALAEAEATSSSEEEASSSDDDGSTGSESDDDSDATGTESDSSDEDESAVHDASVGSEPKPKPTVPVAEEAKPKPSVLRAGEDTAALKISNEKRAARIRAGDRGTQGVSDTHPKSVESRPPQKLTSRTRPAANSLQNSSIGNRLTLLSIAGTSGRPVYGNTSRGVAASNKPLIEVLESHAT